MAADFSVFFGTNREAEYLVSIYIFPLYIDVLRHETLERELLGVPLESIVILYSFLTIVKQ